MYYTPARWALTVVGMIVGLAGPLALDLQPVTACMIDNIPSALASGRSAVTYTGPVNPRHYAPFSFPGVFGAGWALRFSERTALLTLPARLLQAPWRWDFGDGLSATGHAVTHRYRAPGTYVLSVAALLPHQRTAFLFDRILIYVLLPRRILPTTMQSLLQDDLPLLQEASRGARIVARQALETIERGTWASIRDYWLHQQGHPPPAYAHVAAILRQEGAALEAGDAPRAVAIVNRLHAFWARGGSQYTDGQQSENSAWVHIGTGGGVALLLVVGIIGVRLRRRRPAP